MSEIQQLSYEQAEVNREVDRVMAALDTCETVAKWLKENDVNERTEAQARAGLNLAATQLGFESIEDMLGDFDLLANTEVATEGISSIPSRVYDTIAKLIQAIIRKGRMLLAAIFDRSAKETEEATTKLNTFMARLEESEKNIERFDLEPGKKLTAEQRAEIEETGSTVITDIQGRVVDRGMLNNDASILVPAELRNQPYLTYLLKGKDYGDLISNVEEVLNFFSKLSTSIDRSAYYEVLQTIMNMRDENDFNWVLNKGIKEIESADAASMRTLRVRGKKLLTLPPVIGNWYPTFVPERSGPIYMHTMMFSSEEGKMSSTPPSKLPKGLPAISLRDLDKLRDVTAQVHSRRAKAASDLQASKEKLETLGAATGDSLRTAADDLMRYHNGRNDKDIETVQGLIRSIPKSHGMAIDHLEKTEEFLRQLGSALDAYVVTICGKED